MRKAPDKMQPPASAGSAMSDRIASIRAHYEHRISPQAPPYQVLDWSSHDSQHARFGVLAGNVDLAAKTLLDVGCGLGDLWGYLKSCGVDARYTGVDILEKMVAAAGQRHSDARFVCADLFGDSAAITEKTERTFEPGSFDVVFCSGIFNLNLGNNHDFLARGLARLLELARSHLVFNLLHSRAQTADSRYFHYDPHTVMSMLESLPCSVKLIDDYLPNDFTLICKRIES